MNIIIVISILSVFILMSYLSDKYDKEGLFMLGMFGSIFTFAIGILFTIMSVSSREVVTINPIVTKSPHKVHVDWVNYEGNDRHTVYNKHLDYVQIDSSTEWKVIINSNDWGYTWCDDGDIFYENK